MSEQLVFALHYEAEADVVVNPHAEECVRAHPNEVCPGYPHPDDAQEG